MALGQKLREARERMNLTASQVAAATRMKVQTVEAIEREDFSRIPATIYGKGFIKLYAELVGLPPKPLIDEYLALVSASSSSGSPRETPARAETPPAAGQLAASLPHEDGGSPAPSHKTTEAAAAATRAPKPPAREAHVGPTGDLFDNAGGSRAVQSMRPEVQAEDVQDEGLGDVFHKKGHLVWEREPAAPEGRRSEQRGREAESGMESPLRSVGIVVGIVIVTIFLVSGIVRCSHHTLPAAPARTHPTSQTLQVAAELPEPYID